MVFPIDGGFSHGFHSQIASTTGPRRYATWVRSCGDMGPVALQLAPSVPFFTGYLDGLDRTGRSWLWIVRAINIWLINIW